MLPFELTKDTPYLALSGELWSVFYEYFTGIDRVIKGFYGTIPGLLYPNPHCGQLYLKYTGDTIPGSSSLINH